MLFNLTFSTLLVTILLNGVICVTNRTFPEGFLFGVSSAAYQIEGGWNADGKGPSIWDDFLHTKPESVIDRTNGDVSANSYEYYQDDIDAANNLGVNFYRFSISWSRILPTADISNINEKGIEYYNTIINNLLERNIQPMVTIYHFDLPKDLQTFGGFTNSLLVEYFEEYANLLFSRYGDRVKFWLTLNEPAEFCVKGYGVGLHAPGINAHGIGEYLCGHNALKAHAVAYRHYKNKFYDRFKGKVGIGCDSLFYYSASDPVAADRAMQFSLGWFAHPIFSTTGNYPEVMISQIANNSKQEGRLRSRLPTFSPYWIEKIRGSADFLGINYYTARMIVVPPEPEGENPSIERDKNYNRVVSPEWEQAASDWLYSVPEGLGDILRWIKKQYNNVEVMIIENGWSDKGELNDNGRVKYLRDHLEQVLTVVLNNECNLKGYSVWSLIDNFEWISGYTENFGIYSVNMSSPRRERTPKKSTHFLKTVFSTREIPEI